MPNIQTTTKFEQALKKLPIDVRERIAKTVKLLRNNPHHPSLRTHKRQGDERWQARVTRNYRIYFEMEGDVIRLLHITAHE